MFIVSSSPSPAPVLLSPANEIPCPSLLLKNITFDTVLNLLFESNKKAAISKSKSNPLFDISQPAPSFTLFNPGFLFVKSKISFLFKFKIHPV